MKVNCKECKNKRICSDKYGWITLKDFLKNIEILSEFECSNYEKEDTQILNQNVLKKSDLWRTPKKIYDDLDKEFHFDFDPCPYPKPDGFDGLKCEWGFHSFVNPPYSETEKWVKKSIDEYKKGKIVVMILRLDASTRWFRDFILPNAEIRLFEDRLCFVNTDGKSSRSDHASILAVMDEKKKRLNLPIIYWRK